MVDLPNGHDPNSFFAAGAAAAEFHSCLRHALPMSMRNAAKGRAQLRKNLCISPSAPGARLKLARTSDSIVSPDTYHAATPDAADANARLKVILHCQIKP